MKEECYLHRQDLKALVPTDESTSATSLFSYDQDTIRNVFTMITQAGLGCPRTHYLTTLSGRPLHNLQQTILAANRYRSIERVKEDKGLRLIIKPAPTLPSAPALSQDTDEDEKPIRLRGSGNESTHCVRIDSIYILAQIPRAIYIRPISTYNTNDVPILRLTLDPDHIIPSISFLIRLRGSGDHALVEGRGSPSMPPQLNDHAYNPPRRYECPECSMIIWAPTPHWSVTGATFK